MMWKSCLFLPAEGKQIATFSPDFTKPGKSLLEIPCRNVETKRGARPREEAPFIEGHVQETSLGVSKLKKRNRGCVNLYGKKMTTEGGGSYSYIPKTKLK